MHTHREKKLNTVKAHLPILTSRTELLRGLYAAFIVYPRMAPLPPTRKHSSHFTVSVHSRKARSPRGCSLTKLCLTLCNPMDWSMSGSSVLQYLPECAQIHVSWVSDAIQPSHPLPPPSPFAFNLSQHQGLFLLSQLFTSASTTVLLMNIQSWFHLGLTGLISLQGNQDKYANFSPKSSKQMIQRLINISGYKEYHLSCFPNQTFRLP